MNLLDVMSQAGDVSQTPATGTGEKKRQDGLPTLGYV